jgi:ribonuclease P protein component
MKKKDVEKTLKKGVVTDTSYVRIYARLNTETMDQKDIQVAAVVSKKIHASAVQRHKYQRWIREVVRQQEETLPGNLMLVLVAKPSIKTINSLKQIQESVLSAFSAKDGFLRRLV